MKNSERRAWFFRLSSDAEKARSIGDTATLRQLSAQIDHLQSMCPHLEVWEAHPITEDSPGGKFRKGEVWDVCAVCNKGLKLVKALTSDVSLEQIKKLQETLHGESVSSKVYDILNIETVTCCHCGETVPMKTVHLHQTQFVCDHACWDESLRASE